ncbi:MAG: hypothetical protein K8R21_09655 [Leptospira sp.]|nr:hypothetical protein [Leptospira sp.]
MYGLENREILTQKIHDFNGNNKVIGILADGSELALIFESPELRPGEVKDLNTGMVYRMDQFKSFRNSVEHSRYRDTKNFDARATGKYITGGQNKRRKMD